MPIQVSCECGKRLAAKDELAGKRVKCPGCGAPLLIPQPQASPKGDGISDLLDAAGMRAGVNRCPGCGAEISGEAVLCVMCGYDSRRGHRIKTRVGSASVLDNEDLGEIPVHGNPLLDEAERQIARDKIEQKNLEAGVPWWMFFLALLGIAGFAGGMVAMPQDQVMQNSGYVMMVAGALLSFFCALKLIIAGFKESALQGILIVIIPFYVLYFVVSRWDRVSGVFLLFLAGSAMNGMGYFMANVLGPLFAGSTPTG